VVACGDAPRIDFAAAALVEAGLASASDAEKRASYVRGQPIGAR
jgi:hypothetical protein